jgi:hypothetical protein
MGEFVEGNIVEVIGTLERGERGKANEVLPWRIVGFALPLANCRASCG